MLCVLCFACSSGKAPLTENQAKTSMVIYPEWFLNPGSFSEAIVCGYVNCSFYQNSSASHAFQKALSNAAKFYQAEIVADDAFWATEAGVFWVATDFRETFDSSLISLYAAKFSPIDTFYSQKMVAVLAANSKSDELLYKTRQTVSNSLPSWIESPPKDERFFYAVGAAPEYFYEASSWDNATLQARKQLARTKMVRIKALQKRTDFEGQEKRIESVLVKLQAFQVVKRWPDTKNHIFYVLGRIPKQ
ncbi:LPP20 family lipoprotein [Chloroherpeton thalassium]|nr:LPP20 family lipoprotein [Chloroherpeton thalassium]